MEFEELTLSRDQKYYVVKSYYDYNKMDVSVFTIDEWEHLLQISKVFEEKVYEKLHESDYNYQYSESVYYLYYNPYCGYKGLNDLEYSCESPYEIYETIYLELKKSNELSIDGLRIWMKDNYRKLLENYNKLNL